MKTCGKCGTQAPDEVLVCARCGNELPTAAGLRPRPRTSPLAIIAFLLALFPLFFLTTISGIVLGFIARKKIKTQPQSLKGGGLATAAIVLGFCWIFIGIVAALAIPAYMKLAAKSMQSEPYYNLAAISTAQISYFGDHHTYASTFTAMGWGPEGRHHYSYFLPGEKIESQTLTLELPSGISPAVTRDDFTAVAVGNIDGDETLDVWTINDKKELRNVVNDIMQ